MKYISKGRKNWAVAIFLCYTVLLSLLQLSEMFMYYIFWISSTKEKMFTLNRNPIKQSFLILLFPNACFYFLLPSLHSRYIKISSVLWTCLVFSTIIISFLAQWKAQREYKVFVEWLKVFFFCNFLAIYNFSSYLNLNCPERQDWNTFFSLKLTSHLR